MTLHAQLTSILKDYQANHADTWAKDSFGNFVMYTLTDLAKYEHSESPSKELYLARRINSNLEHVEHKGEVTAEATRLSLLHTRLKAVIDAAIYPLEKKNLEANPPRTLDEFLAHYEALTDKPGFPSRAEFCKEHATLLKACVKSASHLTRFNVDVLELYSREEINALLIADNPFEGYSPTPLLLACHFRSDAIVRFLLTDETIDVNQSLLQPRIIPRHTEYHNSDTPHVYGNPNDPLSEPYTLYNSRNGYYQKPVDVPEQTLTVSPAGTPLQAACRANRKETIM
ncbi:MAG TPA: hypothetical protein VI522_06435, partial [Gammaproteobacteria bacterium]|nr:hypothetical protein [Gammaproteobacteria bacterium]